MLLKKKKGELILQSTITYTITLILAMIVFTMSYGIIMTEAEMCGDDLISSELAVYKDIDMEELGKSDELRKIIITDYEKAFQTFNEYLCKNLNLDEDLNPRYIEYNFIKSRVNIDSFIIYNVYKDSIQTITYNGSHDNKFTDTGFIENAKGSIISPKGNTIENTTVYAKISFNIRTIFNNEKTVSIEEESDILKE